MRYLTETEVMMMRMAEMARARQIYAVNNAVIQYRDTEEMPDNPPDIMKARWEAMVRSVINRGFPT